MSSVVLSDKNLSDMSPLELDNISWLQPFDDIRHILQMTFECLMISLIANLNPHSFSPWEIFARSSGKEDKF